jgi:L-fuculose-phosphate aldolase
VASYDGNLSLRSEEGIYITATRTLKAEAKVEDICLLDLDGNLLEGKRMPSSETMMHLYIYREREDVKGVAHSHPPYSTAFAAARQSMDVAIFPEVILDIGPVPLAEYATPSTEDVPNSLGPHVKWANGILLANHGLVTMGGSVAEAFYRTEKLEHAARTLIAAQLLGGPVPLRKCEVNYLYETHQAFKRRGQLLDCESVDHPSCRTVDDSEYLAYGSCDDTCRKKMIDKTVKAVLKRL